MRNMEPLVQMAFRTGFTVLTMLRPYKSYLWVGTKQASRR